MNIISAKFANPEETAVELNTEESGMVLIDPQQTGVLQETYQQWAVDHETEPYSISVIDPIAQAEAWISKFFSVARLLQMKVWWDTFPHESLPKLGAILQWTSAITSSAIQGGTEFSNPPHTFEEIAQEALIR